MYPPEDRRVVDALRQQAIDEVLARHGGRSELVEVERALVRALAARGLASPSGDWLEGVASGICAGQTYVMSPDSQAAAATLEYSDYGQYLAHQAEVERARVAARSPSTADASGIRAGRAGAALTREQLMAVVLVAVSLVTVVWAARSGRAADRGPDRP